MKKSTMFLVAFTVLFGGFIGYDPVVPSQTTQASEMILPRIVDVPRNSELALLIDLKAGEVSVGESSKDATITIISDVETRPEYYTKTIEIPIYVEDKSKFEKMLNKLWPLQNPAPIITCFKPEEKRLPLIEQ